jgi:acyl-coenzyme A synthetase/AMP-(fatty) acid ligase
VKRYAHPPVSELFLRTPTSEWTRGVAAATADRWAARLCTSLGPRDVAAVAVEDPGVLALVLLAALRARRSLAFLAPAKDRAVLERQMREIQAGVLIADQPALAPDVSFTGAEREAGGTLDPLDLVAATPPSPDGPFLYLRTSGTTGGPGWLRIHHVDAVLAARAMHRMPHYRSGKHRLVFINAPLFHSYGMSAFLEYLHAGSAFALPSVGKAYFDFLKIGREVTTIEGVPDLYAGLARLSRNVAPSLVHVGLGGDFPRKDDIARLCKDHRGPITVSIRYGLTETPSAVAHNVFVLGSDGDWTSSGPHTPLYRLRIVSETGQTCGPMEEGFVQIQGRHLAEDLAAPPMASGRRPVRALRTEDMGLIDEHGRLHVTGRTKHFIKNRGFRINARAVEEAFLAMDAVQDCRVRHDGSELILEAVLRQPVEPAHLLGSAAATLPPYAVPDRVQVVPAIAKTVTGKTVRA